MIEGISAVTLATHNMPRAVRFDRILGFEIIHGGDDAMFELSGWNQLSQSDRPTCRAELVLVGTCHFLHWLFRS